MGRELDRRDFSYNRSTATRETQLESLAAAVSSQLPGQQRVRIKHFDANTGNPRTVESAGGSVEAGNYIQRALNYVSSVSGVLGLAAGQTPEFVPDPQIQRTSGNAVVVNLQQRFKGISVFQAAQAVRFDPGGAIRDTTGTVVTIEQDLAVTPRIVVRDAVLRAAQHTAEPQADEVGAKDQFGQPVTYSRVDLTGFQPKVIATFPDLPDNPTVLEAGPFGDEFRAKLVWFPLNENSLRLSWEVLVTMPNYEQQYSTVVDAESGEILYCRQLVLYVFARGNVYRAHGGIDREMTDFPRPLADYIVPVPGNLPAAFPDDWVAADRTSGNSTNAHLDASGRHFQGTMQDGVLTFDPADPVGDDQKILNIFYYNCFMHDFAYLLGFNEAAGNFQQDNFGRGGIGGDPVDARSWSGTVQGTANMSRAIDGASPIMNMGLVTSTNRHTAFDSTVVFHEFTHGITNRLVGGPMNITALDDPQSRGMGEGWSDYIACVNNNMITVVGSWVLNDPAGIRDFPYDSNFPDHFGKLGTGRYLSSKPHNIGEIWCATLMEMTRNVGINPSLQIVIDALKLSPANPSFLDMRDAILQAAQDLRTVGRITAREHFDIRRQITKVFSRFQMGPRAQSNAAQLTGIVGDPESHWENAAMHGGFLVQSTFGLPSRESGVPLRGNFELVTPLLGGGMSHFWRDNDTVGSPWHGPIPFGARDAVEAISAIQSNLSSSGNGPGNLEVVARVGDRLHFYSRNDAPPFSWHGPDPIPGATSGVAGVPSMLQSRFGARGNIELVVPMAAGGLAYFSRNNDAPGSPWSGPILFGSSDRAEAVCLLQSTLSSSDTGPGNLELVVRVGDRLDFYFRDDASPFDWHGPFVIPGAVGVSGNPSLIQSRFGRKGNFELVVPLAAGGLAHFGRDNDSPGQPWNAPIAFGSSDVVDAVSMIQSDFGFPGNLEVVTKVGNHLEFYWRDSGPAFNWHGPFAIGFAALTVPDLTNLPLPRARQALSNSALSVGRVRTLPPESGTGQLGPEVVVFQLPVPGEQVPRGTRVDISLRRLRIRPFPTFAAVGAGGV